MKNMLRTTWAVMAMASLVGYAQDAKPDLVEVAEGPIQLSTSQFFPPINPSPWRSRPVVKEHDRIQIPVEGVPDQGDVSPVTVTRPSIGARFPGITYTGFKPPDPDIAVSPTHIVQVVNTEIAYFSKAGVKQFQQSLDNTGFFNAVATTNFIFDPRVIYDQAAKRFIVIALEQDESPQVSGLLLAISDDSNPNGNWTLYRINTKTARFSQNFWFDYPAIGYNKDGVVIAGNMFSFTTNSSFSQAIALKKSQLLAGSAVSIYRFNVDGFYTIQPCKTLEAVTTTLYGIGMDTTTKHRFYAWRNFATTPTLSQISVTVPTYVQYGSYAQSTGGTKLDGIGDRMMSSAFRSGALVAAHTAKYSSTVNVPKVRWYEFLVNSWPTSGTPTVKQTGNVALASPNSVFMPGISKNGVGAISLIMTRCSPTRAADLYVCSRKAADPLNSMGPLTLITSSTASSGNPQERWGDYFGICIDPSDSKKLWGVGEAFTPAGLWRTEIASWIAGP